MLTVIIYNLFMIVAIIYIVQYIYVNHKHNKLLNKLTSQVNEQQKAIVNIKSTIDAKIDAAIDELRIQMVDEVRSYIASKLKADEQDYF